MKEPICECTEKELVELLKEWQTRLFLDDWIIKVMFADKDDPDMEGLCGRNEFIIAINTSLIKIRKKEDYGDRLVKYCVEEILVHELLHCKYNWVERDYTSIEVAYYDTKEHALLEQMAKSLIMAKYDIPFSWFKNF